MKKMKTSNKDKAYNIFSKDSECMRKLIDNNYKETWKTCLKKSHVEYQKELHCCLCGHKSLWGVNPDSVYHPEWSYWCSNCDIKLIMVWEKD
jgi:hypothetical protein